MARVIVAVLAVAAAAIIVRAQCPGGITNPNTGLPIDLTQIAATQFDNMQQTGAVVAKFNMTFSLCARVANPCEQFGNILLSTAPLPCEGLWQPNHNAPTAWSASENGVVLNYLTTGQWPFKVVLRCNQAGTTALAGTSYGTIIDPHNATIYDYKAVFTTSVVCGSSGPTQPPTSPPASPACPQSMANPTTGLLVNLSAFAQSIHLDGMQQTGAFPGVENMLFSLCGTTSVNACDQEAYIVESNPMTNACDASWAVASSAPTWSSNALVFSYNSPQGWPFTVVVQCDPTAGPGLNGTSFNVSPGPTPGSYVFVANLRSSTVCGEAPRTVCPAGLVNGDTGLPIDFYALEPVLLKRMLQVGVSKSTHALFFSLCAPSSNNPCGRDAYVVESSVAAYTCEHGWYANAAPAVWSPADHGVAVRYMTPTGWPFKVVVKCDPSGRTGLKGTVFSKLLDPANPTIFHYSVNLTSSVICGSNSTAVKR